MTWMSNIILDLSPHEVFVVFAGIKMSVKWLQVSVGQWAALSNGPQVSV